MLIYAIASPLVSKKGIQGLTGKLVMLAFANRTGTNKATKYHLPCTKEMAR